MSLDRRLRHLEARLLDLPADDDGRAEAVWVIEMWIHGIIWNV